MDIAVLDMPLLDTRRGKDLMGTFLSDIVLQVLSFVAENRARQHPPAAGGGYPRSKNAGCPLWPAKIALPDDFEEIVYLWQQGELQSKEAIAISGLKYSTFYKKVKELEDGKINSDTL